jgi:hypothetical protein
MQHNVDINKCRKLIEEQGYQLQENKARIHQCQDDITDIRAYSVYDLQNKDHEKRAIERELNRMQKLDRVRISFNSKIA